ncbi:MAG: HypC/HybG/HupF family hydrogenase formation chaperone [Acidimicrobiales bacterium]|nr:HypC/HybG/HupF family hydrogenase formation chaperone [Acidimicrobiales bacterium]
MCLGVPGQIVERAAGADVAVVDVSGVRRSVDVTLLADGPVAVGDWVLVHVGFALSRIDEEGAIREAERRVALGEDPP